MNNQFKRIIAKEGLIIIACAVIGVVLSRLLPYFPYGATPVPPRDLTIFELISEYKEFIGVYAYFLSWIIRFIIWAINVQFPEPGRSKRTKTIIAREGLILIGIIVIGYVITATPELYIKWPAPIRVYKAKDKSMSNDLLFEQEVNRKDIPIDLLTETRWVNLKTCASEIYSTSDINVTQERRKQVKRIGFIILLFGYPVYLLVRFIAWAIRILRTKE